MPKQPHNYSDYQQRSTSPSAESMAVTSTHDLAVGSGSADAMARTVENWHNDETTHTGAFSTCSDQPCNAIVRLIP